jgi:ABC-type multidrug transport system fused ATPase/permease subunit
MGEDYDDRKKVYDRLKESVIFKNVSFSYGNLKVLDNINIEIHPKKTIGIVGPSGVGKSTLIDLLVGLHKPCEGEVLIDSINLSKYNLETFREHIGYVMQDDIMFNDTIYNNLIFGLSSVDTEWVEHCAKLANIYQFIIETPDGFNTNIGESGIRLSGGQKQRLSLARALIRRPDILILDEGTSALDSDSERIIRNSINNISHKMTIVMIAHRISTLEDTDIIYVIDKGKCVESGTYTELLSVGGYFAKMHNLQITQKS